MTESLQWAEPEKTAERLPAPKTVIHVRLVALKFRDKTKVSGKRVGKSKA